MWNTTRRLAWVLALASCGDADELEEVCATYGDPASIEVDVDDADVALSVPPGRQAQAADDPWHFLSLRVDPVGGGRIPLHATWPWPADPLTEVHLDRLPEGADELVRAPLEPGVSYEVSVTAEWFGDPDRRTGRLVSCPLARGALTLP